MRQKSLPSWILYSGGERQIIATYTINNIYVMFCMEYVLWKERNDKNRNGEILQGDS